MSMHTVLSSQAESVVVEVMAKQYNIFDFFESFCVVLMVILKTGALNFHFLKKPV